MKEAKKKATRGRKVQVKAASTAKPVVASFEDEIRAKIASGVFRSPDSFGKSSQFEVDDKYRAGGMLNPRWVRNSDDAISYRRRMGYLMPSEVHPDLEDQTLGGNILMLCKTEDVERRQSEVQRENERRIGEVGRQHRNYGSSFRGDGYTPGTRTKIRD
tara:strand:- start:1266 stop:1742 length:477 start_codon:yes stop_codon:yes gene_type:complete